MKRLAPLALAVLVFSSCGVVDDDPAVEAAASETNAAVPSGKADIYGADDRRDLSHETSPSVREVGDSTVAILNRYRVRPEGDHHMRLPSRTLASKKEALYGLPLCDGERFKEEPAAASCSGFLIAPDLVATAGHCVSIDTPCDQLAFAFGFDKRDGDPTLIDRRDYRQCKAVVGHLFDRESTRGRALDDMRLYSDWAVVQLDAPVDHRVPLTIRGTKITEGERVYAVGHPGGVPTKVTSGSVVDDHELWFNTDLDIYAGNSGSVIADSNGQAVGIVSRGSGGASYTYNASRTCMTSKTCDGYDPSSVQCSGNQGIHIAPLNRFLRATPVSAEFTGGWGDPIPADGRPIRIPFDIRADGFAHYVTLNARISHHEPTTLEYAIVAPDGTRQVVMDQPSAWRNSISTPTRTTFAFGEKLAEGRWTLEIRDTQPSASASQRVEWAQLVVGVGTNTAWEAPTWIGSACESDADCNFDHFGTPGQCMTSGSGGYCTLPCEGYCPDREGFATTFCVESDFGSGACAPVPHALNAQCASIPGTTRSVASRWVGASGAAPTAREICALP